jgi:hypothetical protein
MESCRKGLARVAGGALLCVFVSASPAGAQMAWTDRAFVNASIGQQWMNQRILTSGDLPAYEETAIWESSFEVDDSFIFDISAGARVWKNLAFAVGFTRTSDTHDTALNAAIPDILPFETFHSDTVPVTGLKREETAFHISAVWMVPVTDKIEIALSGGPSFFSVTQPFVSGMTVTPGQSTIGSVSTSSISESAAGFHIAADGTYRIIRNVGVGATARYSAAKVDAPGIAGGSIDAGGFQGLVGVRVRF